MNNKKNIFDKFFPYSWDVYILISFVAFIIPRDILSQHRILNIFVDFMSNYFYNIKIFMCNSELPEVTGFYTSIIWIIGIFISLIFSFYMIKSVLFTNNFQNIKNNPLKLILYAILGLCLGWFSIDVYYTGDVVLNGIGRGAGHINVALDSRLQIWFFISMFQLWFSLGFGFIAFSIAITLYGIKFYIKRILNEL